MALAVEILQLVKCYYGLPLLLSLIVVRLIFNRYKNGLSGIPGPFMASMTDLWLVIHYVRRRGLEEYQMHQDYNSPILRVGPNMLSISDAEAVKTIYGWKPIFTKVSLFTLPVLDFRLMWRP